MKQPKVLMCNALISLIAHKSKPIFIKDISFLFFRKCFLYTKLTTRFKSRPQLKKLLTTNEDPVIVFKFWACAIPRETGANKMR